MELSLNKHQFQLQMQYKIVWAVGISMHSIAELTEKVNKEMSEGWVCTGGIVINADGCPKYTAQAMILVTN